MAFRLWQVEVWHPVLFMLPVMTLLLLDVILGNIAAKRRRASSVCEGMIFAVPFWLVFLGMNSEDDCISSKPIQRCTQNGCRLQGIHDLRTAPTVSLCHWYWNYLKEVCPASFRQKKIRIIRVKSSEKVGNWGERGVVWVGDMLLMLLFVSIAFHILSMYLTR